MDWRFFSGCLIVSVGQADVVFGECFGGVFGEFELLEFGFLHAVFEFVGFVEGVQHFGHVP